MSNQNNFHAASEFILTAKAAEADCSKIIYIPKICAFHAKSRFSSYRMAGYLPPIHPKMGNMLLRLSSRPYYTTKPKKCQVYYTRFFCRNKNYTIFNNIPPRTSPQNSRTCAPRRNQPRRPHPACGGCFPATCRLLPATRRPRRLPAAPRLPCGAKRPRPHLLSGPIISKMHRKTAAPCAKPTFSCVKREFRQKRRPWRDPNFSLPKTLANRSLKASLVQREVARDSVTEGL